MALYFAYGSNMDPAQMSGRCPDSRFRTIAKFKNHRLAFTRKPEGRGCGVADVVEEEGSHVWGVVYEVSYSDIRKLDKCEGFDPDRSPEANSYNRRAVEVLADGDDQSPATAFTYLAVKECNPPPPSAEYMGLIIEGAKFWGLPEDYIRELEGIEIA